MKKIIFALLLSAILLTSCSEVRLEPDLKSLPENYTLEDAKKDGCIIYEESDIISS